MASMFGPGFDSLQLHPAKKMVNLQRLTIFISFPLKIYTMPTIIVCLYLYENLIMTELKIIIKLRQKQQ